MIPGLCGLIIALIGAAGSGGNDPLPLLTARLQAIRLADDDGGRRARVTVDQVREWVSFCNRVFACAGIKFDFRPDEGDFIDMKSTILNSMRGGARLADEKALCNLVAARYPGKLVVFFRYGPGRRGTGDGFSWQTLRFVVMPGYDDARHCGHPHTDALAHEIGHYLGLAHTHVRLFETEKEASDFLARKGGDPRVFDGDRLDDTPPDPLIRRLECERLPRISLGNVEFVLPRDNIMSYYDERDRLTPSQIKIARWVLQSRMAYDMAPSYNRTTVRPLEAETMESVRTHACGCSVQSMDPWAKHRWSGGRQLFCDAELGGWAEFAFLMNEEGNYSIRLYATRALDYGVVRVYLDNRPLSGDIDMYAPVVEPSGRVTLGVCRLSAGKHLLRIVSVAKNADSTGCKFGIDCIELVPTAGM